MNEPILQDCVGCSMGGNYGVQATHRFETEERVIDNCPDAYEYSLKGVSCAALHYHMEKRTQYLCDKHYEMHQKYKNQDSINLG